MTKLRMKLAALGIALALFTIQAHVNAAPSDRGNSYLPPDQTVAEKVEPVKEAAKKWARSILEPRG